jgi:hypothetical protein
MGSTPLTRSFLGARRRAATPGRPDRPTAEWHNPFDGRSSGSPINQGVHTLRSEGRLHTLGPTRFAALPNDVRATQVHSPSQNSPTPGRLSRRRDDDVSPEKQAGRSRRNVLSTIYPPSQPRYMSRLVDPALCPLAPFAAVTLNVDGQRRTRWIQPVCMRWPGRSAADDLC